MDVFCLSVLMVMGFNDIVIIAVSVCCCSSCTSFSSCKKVFTDSKLHFLTKRWSGISNEIFWSRSYVVRLLRKLAFLTLCLSENSKSMSSHWSMWIFHTFHLLGSFFPNRSTNWHSPSKLHTANICSPLCSNLLALPIN